MKNERKIKHEHVNNKMGSETLNGKIAKAINDENEIKEEKKGKALEKRQQNCV